MVVPSRRSPLQHHTHYLGYDVTRAPYDYRVANTNILTMYLANVVQRHIAYGDPAYKHRLEPCDGCQNTGTPHLKLDPADDGERLFRRKLVRDGPTRRTRYKPQTLLVGAAIELIDHSVDLVWQRLPPRTHVAVVREQSVNTVDELRVRADRQAPAFEGFQQAALMIWDAAALDAPEAIEIKLQRPLRGNAGVQHPQAPRGGVARIDEYLFARLARNPVHALKPFDGHEHFAANFQHLGRLAV